MTKVPSVIHWFRLDLRLHDNLALRNAINEAENRKHLLKPIYVIDPEIRNGAGCNRVRFLLQSLKNLDESLRKINTRLYIIRGKAVECLPKLFDEWNVKFLTLQVDIDAELVKQDEVIEDVCDTKEIFMVKRVQHTIYDFDSVLKKNNGSIPRTYHKFLSLVSNVQVKDVIQISKNVCDECKASDYDSEEYDIPSLEELGINESDLMECKYPGGETEGLKRLDIYMAKKQWVCNFEKRQSSPNSIEPSTTVLSPYISQGCISAKLFYHKLKEVESGMKHTLPPRSLLGQLLWREFFYISGAGTKNFDRMVGNSLCTQIPWKKNDTYLKAWAEGKTGYPFIDAIMRQLKQEGWIHHLAREMVACFLTRGDLWVSWEEGAKVFEEYLLDYDWSSNAANWMWHSTSGFYHAYHSVYSPVAFGKKTDKDGLYIKKYVPELNKYPSEFIYEPWQAPKEVQKTAGCIIGEDYQNRIVDHDKAHKENIQKMTVAYKQGKEKKHLRDQYNKSETGAFQ